MEKCYNDPEYPKPGGYGTASDLFQTYNDLRGRGVRQHWSQLTNEIQNVAKSHSYAQVISQKKQAWRYDLAFAAASRHQNDIIMADDIVEKLEEFKKLEKLHADLPGIGAVDTGPSLPKTRDYLAEKPERLSDYERWVLNRKAVFAMRTKLPMLTEADETSGYVEKSEAGAIWTESALKRNKTMFRRNKLCEKYNDMVDECRIAVEEMIRDKGFMQGQIARILTDLMKFKESTFVRKSLYAAIAELHEYINDLQFEIFKTEQMALELNSVLTAAIHESDMVNEGKKKLLQSMENKVYRYSRQLVAQKSDMYNQYREKTSVLANLCEEVAEPVLKTWQKVRETIKASIILTKQAVAELTPDCPLYPIIKEELKKADVPYAQEEDSLEQLGKDNSTFTIIEQIDQVFSFFQNITAYLYTEGQSMTASMELNEIIRSWKDCQGKMDDCD